MKNYMLAMAFVTVVLAIAFPVGAMASPEVVNFSDARTSVAESAFSPRIRAGNFQISGGFGTSESPFSRGVSLNPSFSYFVADLFSLGVAFSYSDITYRDREADERYVSSGVGPELTYYFTLIGNAAPFVSVAYDYQNTEGYRTTAAATALGSQFFFTDTLAFGVRYYYRSRLTSDSNSERFATSGLQGSFGYFF